MFRISARRTLAVATSLTLLTSVSVDKSFNSNQTPGFDTRGFPTRYEPPREIFPAAKPLYLSAVGMRRKNFYIVEVDVYLIGLNLTPDALSRSKAALIKNSNIAEAMLNSTTKGNFPEVAMNLNFVRSVSTQQVVDAFDEAFVGCNPESVMKFKTSLKDVIGQHGMKNGERISFFWKADGGLLIAKDHGAIGTVIQDREIELRLLEVYVNPSRTVSKQLTTSIAENLPFVNF